jgi:hypothetical protein
MATTSFFFEITIGGQKGLVSYRTDQEPHQLAVYSWQFTAGPNIRYDLAEINLNQRLGR